jgi:hypothetical protein
LSDFTAIERVSRALQGVLTDALGAVGGAIPPVAELHNLQPPPGGQPPVLALFLYEIVEDYAVRNRDQQRELLSDQGGQRYRITRPPMALVLRYLMTAYAAGPTAPNTEQLMIGRAMQVLYQRQVRRGADLDPQLDLPLLSVTLSPLTLDERSRVWWAIQQPYRLSLNYEVRVVDIDVAAGDIDVAAPVRERELDSHLPEATR